MEAAILHTLTKDGLIDEIFASFTDEDAFVAWAEDWIKKNPDRDLFFTELSLNPMPGEMSDNKVRLATKPSLSSTMIMASHDLHKLRNAG